MTDRVVAIRTVATTTSRLTPSNSVTAGTVGHGAPRATRATRIAVGPPTASPPTAAAIVRRTA